MGSRMNPQSGKHGCARVNLISMEDDELPVAVNPTTQLDQQRVMMQRWLQAPHRLQFFVATSRENRAVVSSISIHCRAQFPRPVVLPLLRSKRIAEHHSANKQVADITGVVLVAFVEEIV